MNLRKHHALILAFAGLASVLSAAPVMTTALTGGSVVITVSNGIPGATNYLISAAALGLPIHTWPAIGTNVFDATGRSVFTNSTLAISNRFYASKMSATAFSNLNLWVPECGALLGTVVTNASATLVAQHEADIGRSLDILRVYHTAGSWTQLTSSELAYINAGRKLLMSVKPDAHWSNAVGVANGGSAAIDSQMTTLARSIAAIKPAKIMLIVWHEPENDVIGSVPDATAGTTAQYAMMWHNVRSIFDANGATNMIWCWNVENYAPLRYLLPALWPGNTNVDWVMWDQYQSSSTKTYTNVLQDGYNWMTSNSTPTTDYLSKPWGLAEWGVGVNDYHPTVADQTNGINGLTVALNQNHQFSRIKLIEYFDEGAGTLLPGVMNAYSNFANSLYLMQQCLP